MNLVFLGPPGAGKGTQTAKLVERYHLTTIATGVLVREEIKAETPLGLKIKSIVEAGQFPEDSIIIDLARSALQRQASKGQGLIFDGFPRTLNQAEALQALLEELGLHIDQAIYLNVDEEALVERITNRFQCAACGEIYHKLTKTPHQEGICDRCGGTTFAQRADDKEDALRVRLNIYKTQTAPVIEYYRTQGVLATIDGNQSVDNVWQQIARVLEQSEGLKEIGMARS